MGRTRDRRTEILKKAARTFLESGYDAVSMNLVAEQAEVTKPGLYYHFEGKQDLLFSIMSYAMDALERETQAAIASAGSLEERLHAMLLCHARMTAEKDDGSFTILVIDETKGLREEDREVMRRRKRAYVDLLRDTLEGLEAEGKLRDIDPTVAAFSLLGMVLWLSKWFEHDGRLSAAEVARQVADMALAAVLEDQPAIEWRQSVAQAR